jgi:predicted kinase
MSRKLVLVGGFSGSGKTHLGKILSKDVGFFVDKDTLSKLFTEKILTILGESKNDRESETYLSNVRGIEYEVMMNHAFDNLLLKKSVVCSAPFIKEFNDPDWMRNLRNRVISLDTKLITIWVHSDTETTYKRIMSRKFSRDKWKLENWDTYTNNLPDISKLDKNIIVLDNSEEPEISILDQLNILVNKI